jgi:hypothetical protein
MELLAVAVPVTLGSAPVVVDVPGPVALVDVAVDPVTALVVDD